MERAKTIQIKDRFLVADHWTSLDFHLESDLVARLALIESMHAAGNPVALVCHAPGALRNAKAQDGSPLVKGKRVTGFTDTEEQAVQLTKVVPFLVEDELKRLGGLYAKGPDWAS